MKNISLFKRISLQVLIFSLSVIPLSAQTLKGVIVSTTGDTVSGATIFIQSIGLGVVADSDGAFSINIAKGRYSCEFRSMGYQTVVKDIEVGDEDTFIEIILPFAAYMLPEVRVGKDKEDPAYYIIRRTIAMAPYYKSYIAHYSYEAHQKGTYKVDKIALIGNKDVNGISIKELLGKTFIVESIADVSFSTPNNYTLHVKAYNSSVPVGSGFNIDNFSIKDESIYNDNIYGCTSPISADALKYYRYSYEGGREEGEYWVSKIWVEPKKSNPSLLSGYIYINEGTWNVVLLDFKISALGVSTRYQQYFNQIKPNIFVPTSESTEFSANVMGLFKANGETTFARKYSDIEVDISIPAPNLISLPKNEEEEIPVIAEIAPLQSKNEQKIQEMLSKGSMNNREAYKLAQLLQKDMEDRQQGEKERSLEITRDGDMNITRSADSLASKRDSIYWSHQRILPLSIDDMQSYNLGDSLKIKHNIDSTNTQDNITINVGDGPITGYIKIFDKEKWTLRAGGLLSLAGEYNFVDGFLLGEELILSWRPSDKVNFFIRPAAHYTTGRRQLSWRTEMGLSYAPMRQGRLSMEIGDNSEDFNRERGVLRIENTTQSLFSGDPLIHFYRSRYLRASNSIDLDNGLKLSISGEYSRRLPMNYVTTYSIFSNKSIRTNIPESDLYAITGIQDSRQLQTSVELSYTPKFYYRITASGRKNYIRSDYPTFGVSYKKGWKIDDLHHNPEFDRIEFNMRQRINLGLFDNIRYSLNAGKFLSKKNLSFADVRHFLANPLTASAKNTSGFHLLELYTHSTDRYWGQAEFDYTSAYLLIKNIPVLQGMLFDETLHLRYLYTPAKQHYWEAGYSIGLSDMLRVGVWTGWDKFTYRGVGFSINISPFPNWVR